MVPLVPLVPTSEVIDNWARSANVVEEWFSGIGIPRQSLPDPPSAAVDKLYSGQCSTPHGCCGCPPYDKSSYAGVWWLGAWAALRLYKAFSLLWSRPAPSAAPSPLEPRRNGAQGVAKRKRPVQGDRPLSIQLQCRKGKNGSNRSLPKCITYASILLSIEIVLKVLNGSSRFALVFGRIRGRFAF